MEPASDSDFTLASRSQAAVIRTPTPVYAALVFLALAPAVPFFALRPDLASAQPDGALGAVLLGIFGAIACGILGIIFAVVGAWNGPRSSITRITASLASLYFVALLSLPWW